MVISKHFSMVKNWGSHHPIDSQPFFQVPGVFLFYENYINDRASSDIVASINKNCIIWHMVKSY